MSRKDYVRIAAAINAALQTEISLHGADSGTAGGIRLAARRVADALQADNGRFDRERFMVACFKQLPLTHSEATFAAGAL